MQARLKRHDWHMKLLKAGDPITVSAGWRRYQTIPIYASELDSKQYEIAKYTPQYEHCLAMFWGPPAPPYTRIAVAQGNKEEFRITATAIVLDPKHPTKIVKESKWIGKPHKILKRRAALIKFTPDTDVAKFIGETIRTGTHIWGKITEATKREGIARCTFSSRIDMRDTVFMRVIRQVEAPPRFLYPLAAVEPHDNLVPVNKDSLKKEDPAHRQLRLEQRRGVKFPDEDPCSYSFLKYLMLQYMTENVRRDPVVVMSEEKRGALTMKRKREEHEKQRKKIGQMVTF
ncbi:ribosome biogenesis protein BMS1 homolog [Papaver somniferum]|uniref:ribosome biogenesis protein BMS1 homolog n=1 Tax=Papaver somniferum TaxID=3469 RepID=UPI000E6F689C|nr:ribosome biogenesis protein BMS1 homolog [Papaver somniferum]XP_026431240.1 ribosome biogenesis protein BMS1 homolog [Papaver somniferum]XP_026431242.1 ribosome biogenesis protein BMS1 homolog [Papaver somniferum]XP_026431243.1 ribosome biogenesis protein BMS1 homolog [Papaver somniferum]